MANTFTRQSAAHTLRAMADAVERSTATAFYLSNAYYGETVAGDERRDTLILRVTFIDTPATNQQLAKDLSVLFRT